MKERILTRWYFFWGNLVSKIMHYGILAYLYPLYNRWMIKSVRYDMSNEFWKQPTEGVKK